MNSLLANDRPTELAIPTQAIRAARPAIEANRRLPAALVETLTNAGLFRLYTPREHGGLELDPVAFCAVLEEVSALDASVGWCLWNGNCGFAAAMMEPEAAEQVFGAGEPVGNAARVGGGAVPIDGGYRFSGRWDLVSGCDHQARIILFGVVMDGDQPRLVGPELPDVRAFVVEREQFSIVDKWHVLGLRGTASNEVTVSDAFIPEALSPSPFAPTRIDRTLFHIPVFTTAGCGGAAVCLGIARSAIDALVELAATKVSIRGDAPIAAHPTLQAALARSDIELRAARAALYEALGAMVTTAEAGRPALLMERGRVRAAMTQAAQTARTITIRMFELASSSAIYQGHPLEQSLRDVMVATQHVAVQSIWFEEAGRTLLGFEPTLAIL